MISIDKGVLRGVKLSKTYLDGSTSVTALKEADITIEKGKFYSIMGPSGSGKTTLLQILGLLDLPTRGEMYVDGVVTTTLSRVELVKIRMHHIGFVFQFFHLLPHLRAWENVCFPMMVNDQINRAERKEKAIALLERVGLCKRIDHFPFQLSGGEQQRVAIARALANDPKCILADEPTGNVDEESEQQIIQILQELCKQDRAVVVVTHNEALGNFADIRYLMKQGKLVNREDH